MDELKNTPTLQFAPEVLLQAQGSSPQGIKAAIFDVDGVLTDSGLYYTEGGETFKRFNVLDGQGFVMLAKAGIERIVITGRDSAPVRRRMADFGIKHAYYGVSDKFAIAQETLDRLGCGWEHVAVIGDDWPDLPLFARAAFAVAPANAHAEVKAAAHYITQRHGGHGAAREFCDILLVASGWYDRIYQGYCSPGRGA